MAGVSSFTLKLVAIAGMTANHVGDVFGPLLPWPLTCALLALGGVTFPIMAFLITEGYRYTSNFTRYALRLALFALVSQVPFQLVLAPQGNVLFTLLIGLLLLRLHDSLNNRLLFGACFVAGCVISALCDWGVIGPLIIVMMQLISNKRQRIGYPTLVLVVGLGLTNLLQFAGTGSQENLAAALFGILGCGGAGLLLLGYDGTRGRPLKYFFYAYYPLHIALLGVLGNLWA